MTEAEYEREIARLKMNILSIEGSGLNTDGDIGYCPWCSAFVSHWPAAYRAGKYTHFDRCPAFTPEGVVK